MTTWWATSPSKLVNKQIELEVVGGGSSNRQCHFTERKITGFGGSQAVHAGSSGIVEA
jgi:hypothetical protein